LERADSCYPSWGWFGKSWLLLSRLVWKELAPVIPADLKKTGSCHPSWCRRPDTCYPTWFQRPGTCYLYWFGKSGSCYPCCCLLSQLIWKKLAPVIPADVEDLTPVIPPDFKDLAPVISTGYAPYFYDSKLLRSV
jgi:hypothetical protein